LGYSYIMGTSLGLWMPALRRIAFCFVFSTAALSMGCSRAVSRPSTCDGLSEKTVGITREDYSPCAGEILAALDGLEHPLRQSVSRGDEEAGPEAEAHYKRLRYLMRQVGFTADLWRESREGAGRKVERWPDSTMRLFNTEVGTATAQYMSALRRPNDDNLKEGQRHHAVARRAYARFR
jgi:hypothetical protein